MARSLELGKEAMDLWPEGRHQVWLAHHIHVYGNPMYWSGRYREAYELAMQAKSFGGLKANSAEFVLRGAGMTGLALAGMGRYEEALTASESAIAIAQRLGRPDNVVINYSTFSSTLILREIFALDEAREREQTVADRLGDNVVINYSTLILREIFALDEARERSQIVADRLGSSDFNMPWMNARADLIAAELLLVSSAPWNSSGQLRGTTRKRSRPGSNWPVSGRLAIARAQLELGAGRLDEAVTWSRRALEMAQSGGRPKYEAIALHTLGQSLTQQGLADDAAAELSRAVAIADELGVAARAVGDARRAGVSRASRCRDPEPRVAVRLRPSSATSHRPSHLSGARYISPHRWFERPSSRRDSPRHTAVGRRGRRATRPRRRTGRRGPGKRRRRAGCEPRGESSRERVSAAVGVANGPGGLIASYRPRLPSRACQRPPALRSVATTRSGAVLRSPSS